MGSGMKPIEFNDFLQKTQFSLQDLYFPSFDNIKYVIGLREMREIVSVNAMSKKYLSNLLSKIGTVGSFNEKVYKNSTIHFIRIDPHSLRLGQKFVYRKNYISILENFPNIFDAFHISRGISKLTAFIILGKDSNGDSVLAHYIPPIVEIHNGHLLLMDGVHRNFIVKNSGTTIESIVISNVNTPFPCTAHKWSQIKITDNKPENINDRYFDLQQELFRDLKSIGIDG